MNPRLENGWVHLLMCYEQVWLAVMVIVSVGGVPQCATVHTAQSCCFYQVLPGLRSQVSSARSNVMTKWWTNITQLIINNKQCWDRSNLGWPHWYWSTSDYIRLERWACKAKSLACAAACKDWVCSVCFAVCRWEYSEYQSSWILINAGWCLMLVSL